MKSSTNHFPTCSLLIGDFDTRCSKWCNNDINNAKCRALDILTSSAEYKQIISKPAHTVNNSVVII